MVTSGNLDDVLSLFLYGAGGPTGVGVEVEFPLVLLVMLPFVTLPVIVLPLEVWLLCVVVCASADKLAKFTAAREATTNTPTAPIMKPSLNMSFM
jgi:hypothetical protein